MDECHHAAAPGFADVILAFPGRRILGLTATPEREDGRGAALPMLLGPVLGRFAGASVERRILRPLSWRGEIAVPPDADYPFLLNALAEDPARLAFAADAAAALLREGRGLLVLTERVSHADALEPRLREAAPFVLRLRSGAKGKREAMAALAKFAAQGAPKPFAILATGKLAGEGFDFPPLDALLLAMPVMSERLVKQYAGRILRRLDGKDDAVIADIVDESRGIFAAMWKRRRRIYAEIGFSEEAAASDLWHPAPEDPANGRSRS